MPAAPREVWLLQRKTTKVGDGLAKTTGWIRRTLLQEARRARCWPASSTERSTTPACTYASTAKPQVLPVDTIVVCAGQEPRRELVDGPARGRASTHTLIGGADVAAELDAKRAIEQGTRVALSV